MADGSGRLGFVGPRAAFGKDVDGVAARDEGFGEGYEVAFRAADGQAVNEKEYFYGRCLLFCLGFIEIFAKREGEYAGAGGD